MRQMNVWFISLRILPVRKASPMALTTSIFRSSQCHRKNSVVKSSGPGLASLNTSQSFPDFVIGHWSAELPITNNVQQTTTVCRGRWNYGFLDESENKSYHVFSRETTNTDNRVGGEIKDLWSNYGYYSLCHDTQEQMHRDPMVEEKLSSTSFRISNERSQINETELSTEEVMRIAAAHFIQSSSLPDVETSSNRFPFGVSLSNLSTEETKNVELASFLLAMAEKVSNQQYDMASNLLRECSSLSSSTGNPVQRVVYYFCEALQEKIDRETGKLSMKENTNIGSLTPEKAIKAMLTDNPLHLITQKYLPYAQIIQFTAAQAIIDNVANAKRIHIIDFSIKLGLEWTILLQALASRPSCSVESVAISAVGATEEVIATTGKRLTSFAESLGIPFSFKMVIVSGMEELKETSFEVKEDEVIALYSCMTANTMIARPDCLDTLMRVVCKLRPCVMIVVDCEANHNSPYFINRFTEALFYFSAKFDCIDNMLDRSDENRISFETILLGQGIRNIVATEGKERIVRQVGIRIWRKFFARFGLVEANLNEYSVYQASLISKQFVNGEHCTLQKDGKTLVTGWKGSPMHFISAWKFQKKEVRGHYEL